MGDTARTVEEQITILTNRGLELDINVEKVKEHLRDIGYYRLGFYWNPFKIKDDTDNFKKGITFSTIIKLYYLDAI